MIDLSSPWPYLAVAALAALIGWVAWRGPRRPGRLSFLWIVGLWLAWALAAALQTLANSPVLIYLLWAVQGLSALLVATLELIFVLEYTGHEKWLARRSLLLIFLPPVLLLLLAAALPILNSTIEFQSGAPAAFGSGLIRWGFFGYVLLLETVTLGLLFNCLLRAPAFWAPTLLIALGRIVPTLGFAALAIGPARITNPPIQATVLFASVAMLAYFVAVNYFQLLRVAPVARDQVIAHMPYGLIVLDAENRLADFNAAAQALPGLPHSSEQPGRLALNGSASLVLGSWWEKISPLIGTERVSKDVTMQVGSIEKIFQVMSLPLLQAGGWRIGQVFLFEDVTQTRQAQRQQAQTLWAQATLEERQQLADELHDGLSQSLAFLGLQSQAALLYLQADQGDAAQASLTRLNDAAGEIQAETRQLINSLLSVSLPAENFCDTLGQMLAGFEQETGLAVHLDMDIDTATDMNEICGPHRLPPPAAVQLIRITQEALANVRKHARGASQVSVQLKAIDGTLSLTISDDGVGFDPTGQRTAGKHFGLQVMRQRAARIGGQIMLHAAPGRGACVEVLVPLADERNGSISEPSRGSPAEAEKGVVNENPSG